MGRIARVNRLRSFRRWLTGFETTGATQYVFELEMWLKSLECYFRVANLPMSEEAARQITLRDYSEELGIVSDVIFRVSQVCTFLLSEEKVSYSSFANYINNSLKQDYFTDKYIQTLLRVQTPEKNLNLLMLSLLDVRTVILELSKLEKISYLCFGGMGRIVHRELRKGIFLEYFLEKKFVPLFYKVTNPTAVHVVRSIQIPRYKRSIASIFLEMYRVLRYLSFVRLQMEDANELKRSLLIFSLVHAEIKSILSYMEDEFIREEHPDAFFTELIEVIIFSLSMELKKVIHIELVGAASLKQYDLIFAKIKNSEDILLNSLQHILVSIAQYFDPKVEGHDLFPDYVTRLDQSVRLRIDLLGLFEFIRKFTRAKTLPELSTLLKRVEVFRAGSMKILMYKDWSEFDSLYQELIGCRASGTLNFTLHRFEVYFLKLIKEVNKRSILRAAPAPRSPDRLLGPLRKTEPLPR
jgi:hypothetical protein